MRIELVLPQRHLCLYLPNKVNKHLDCNKESRTADKESSDARNPLDYERYDRNQAEEHGSRKRNAVHDRGDIVLSLTTRTHTWNKGSDFWRLSATRFGSKVIPV